MAKAALTTTTSPAAIGAGTPPPVPSGPEAWRVVAERKSAHASLAAQKAQTRLDQLKVDIQDMQAFDALGGFDNPDLLAMAASSGIDPANYAHPETAAVMLFRGQSFLGKKPEQKKALVKRAEEKGNAWCAMRDLSQRSGEVDPVRLSDLISQQGGQTKLTRAYMKNKKAAARGLTEEEAAEREETLDVQAEIRARELALTELRSRPAAVEISGDAYPDFPTDEGLIAIRDQGKILIFSALDVKLGVTQLKPVSVEDLSPHLNFFCEMAMVGATVLPHLPRSIVAQHPDEDPNAPGTITAPANRVYRWEGGCFTASNARIGAGIVVQITPTPTLSLPSRPSFINVMTMNRFDATVASRTDRRNFSYGGVDPNSENLWPTVVFKGSTAKENVNLTLPEMTSLGSSKTPYWILKVAAGYAPGSRAEFNPDTFRSKIQETYSKVLEAPGQRVLAVELKGRDLSLTYGKAAAMVIGADFADAGGSWKVDVLAEDFFAVFRALREMDGVKEVELTGDPQGLLELRVLSSVAAYRFFIPALTTGNKERVRAETLLTRVTRRDYA